MAVNLSISLTDELRRYVETRANDSDVYATPDEYIRDLIRRDMQEQTVVTHVLEGLDDIKQGRISAISVLDILNEE